MKDSILKKDFMAVEFGLLKRRDGYLHLNRGTHSTKRASLFAVFLSLGSLRLTRQRNTVVFGLALGAGPVSSTFIDIPAHNSFLRGSPKWNIC